MEVLECIKTRRSIRKYLDKPLPWELIANVMEAGRYAPSAGNLQNWKFIAVMSEGRRKAIAEASLQQYWMEQAPVHIVICSEPEKGEMHYGKRGKENYTIQNSAAAAMSASIRPPFHVEVRTKFHRLKVIRKRSPNRNGAPSRR